MQESCSYGSVGGWGGNELSYPENYHYDVQRALHVSVIQGIPKEAEA
jgi:hypothetical protein